MESKKRFCARAFNLENGHWYSRHLMAKDWEEAQKICEKRMWHLDGEWVMDIDVPESLAPTLQPIMSLITRFLNWLKGGKG